MTNNEREALIEKARVAISAKSWEGFEPGESFAEAYARVAFDVFEQSHTPTDDERARVIAELRWLADARKEYETDTFPQIAREVQTARQLADILERKTPVSDGGQGFGWMPSWRWNEWDDMALRRPVQGEPSDAMVRGVWDALGPGITVAFEYEELRAALRAAFQEGENRG